MSGSIDLSNVTALAPLADVARDVVRAAERADAEIFVVGAIARDLWLKFVHGFDTLRATEDFDFAVQCGDWNDFSVASSALLDSGFVRPDAKIQHRFRHPSGALIDIVPFGGLERADRKIAWPPNEDEEMNLVGFREALDSTVQFVLPGGSAVPVVSLAALAGLKVIAWDDRWVRSPGKDARDLLVILCNYADAGNYERMFEVIPGLAERADFDLECAGAELLGHDLARISRGRFREMLLQILEREASATGDLRLAAEMDRRDVERARELLAALRTGLPATRDAD